MLVSEVVLRSQAQAEYNPANIGHFGLNLRRYAHFTSPIRRYADLIVHRALIRALQPRRRAACRRMPASDHLAEIAAQISAAERRAMAGRARHRRSAGGALAGRPDRRDVSAAAFRASPAPGCS